jgi:Family of unknown function (DUF6262)
MRADNTGPLINAARQRHELTRAKAIQALRELDQAGAPVTFEAVARAAGVSRSWLYAQADLRVEITRLREATHRSPSPPIPASQRASGCVNQNWIWPTFRDRRALSRARREVSWRGGRACGVARSRRGRTSAV